MLCGNFILYHLKMLANGDNLKAVQLILTGKCSIATRQVIRCLDCSF